MWPVARSSRPEPAVAYCHEPRATCRVLLLHRAAFRFAIGGGHFDPPFTFALVLAGAVVAGAAARALTFAGVDALTVHLGGFRLRCFALRQCALCQEQTGNCGGAHRSLDMCVHTSLLLCGLHARVRNTYAHCRWI